MNAKHMLLVLVAAMMLCAAPADAALYKFNVVMDGFQETPPVATTGSGTAMVFYNDVTGMMDVNGTFDGLIGNTTAAHVHGFAPPGMPAGVIFPLTVSPGTSGTVMGSGTIGDSASVLAGLTYINIHSNFRPGGEIRGQIAGPMLIPEPASVSLLGIGVAGLFSFRRRSCRS
jgi:hypothetical protein